MRPTNLTDAPLWRTMLMFLLPLMGSNILQSLSGTVTSIYLGRMLGVGALAAVSAFFPFLFLMISFLIGLSNGSTVLIGQAHGARNTEGMRAVAGTTITVVGLLGISMALFGGLFTRTLLAAVGTPADILPEASDYARVIFIFVPLLFLFLGYTTFLRGTGDSHTSLYALLLATAISLALTPAFILGFAGLPRLGVTSGAWASVVAYTIALAWLFMHLHRRGNPLALNMALLKHLWIDPQILKVLLRIGLPSGLQMIMVSLSEIAVISFVNRFGSNATAAYGAVNQVVSYVQFPAISVSITASIFGAQAIGAGNPERLTRIARTAALMSLVIVGLLVIAAYSFSRSIVGWFIDNPDTIEIAHRLLMITLWSYLVFGTSVVLSGVMRASGAVLWPTAISIFSIWGIEVPVAYWLSYRVGIDGIWIGYPVAFLGGLALQASYFHFVWRRRTHARLI